jgi:predicted O-methyltransferase YrrM
MEFIPLTIARYAEEHSQAESDLLNDLVRTTHLKTTQPRMLSGHLQGRLLSLISHLVSPSAIFEIGTFTGYATLCLAEGLTSGGKIITCDVDEETSAIATEFFRRSAFVGSIEVHVEDALQVLSRIEVPFDLVFIDGDKLQYLDYYLAVLPRLRTGGVIVADNVLWSGKVVDKSFNDPETESLRSFNTFVLNDHRVVPLLLPVRDGLMLIRKVV